MAKFTLNVNGKTHDVDADPDMPLLYALENDIGLNNPQFGCGLAQCGACTVHMDGQPIRSCVTPRVVGRQRQGGHASGLGTPEKPHPLQTAYVEEQVHAVRLLHQRLDHDRRRVPAGQEEPDRGRDQAALEGLKCRCGTHMNILRAVKRAATMMG